VNDKEELVIVDLPALLPTAGDKGTAYLHTESEKRARRRKWWFRFERREWRIEIGKDFHRR
jgi:hypothetical protein